MRAGHQAQEGASQGADVTLPNLPQEPTPLPLTLLVMLQSSDC